MKAVVRASATKFVLNKFVGLDVMEAIAPAALPPPRMASDISIAVVVVLLRVYVSSLLDVKKGLLMLLFRPNVVEDCCGTSLGYVVVDENAPVAVVMDNNTNSAIMIVASIRPMFESQFFVYSLWQ